MTTRSLLYVLLALAGLTTMWIAETRVWADLWFPLFVLGSAGVVATLIALMKRGETPFTKWHHAYLGFALAVNPWSMGVQVLGLLVIADDLYQHVRQIRDPLYLSPLHVAYVRVYRWLRRPR